MQGPASFPFLSMNCLISPLGSRKRFSTAPLLNILTSVWCADHGWCYSHWEGCQTDDDWDLLLDRNVQFGQPPPSPASRLRVKSDCCFLKPATFSLTFHSPSVFSVLRASCCIFHHAEFRSCTKYCYSLSTETCCVHTRHTGFPFNSVHAHRKSFIFLEKSDPLCSLFSFFNKTFCMRVPGPTEKYI